MVSLDAFPDHPNLQGNYAPMLEEHDLSGLEIEGTVPADLSGSLYRIGPNPHFPPRDGYHWFAGDGMVHALHIGNGAVDYINRWVRTPKWNLENDAGKALFGAFGNPMTSDPSAIGEDAGLANTNIVWHGNRLLALEEAHPPTELNPRTLATEGYFDFSGNPLSRVTAHPKFDPDTGEMVFFAYSIGGFFKNRMGLYVADKAGRLTRSDEFDVPYCGMVHDFIVTQNYIVLPLLPLTGELERVTNGGPAFAWDPQKGAYLGVIRRDQPIEEMRWIEIDPCYVFHPVNAYEDSDQIIAEVFRYGQPPLFPNPDGSEDEDADRSAYLTEWRIDLTREKLVREARLDDLPGEFPRFDERFSGLRHRYSWFAYRDVNQESFSFNGIAQYDNQAACRTTYTLPAGDAFSEPVFVPRHETTEEGDGYILTIAYRADQGLSELMIFQGLSVETGPVATVKLGARVPFGFHGNWRDDKQT